MIEFESMNNLLQKKKIAEIEIEYLNNEKEKIEAIYSDEGNNAPTNESKAPFNSEHDKKIAELTHKLAFDNKYNQMNLIERLDYVKEELEKCNKEIEKRRIYFDKLEGIKNELYKMIVFEGVNTSKAVETVSEMYGKSTSTIWKYYYSKIKKYLRN